MMLLIQNIHVFNPEYQGIKDVLITGNTIHKIADSLPVTAAYEMKVIDGTGKFLIPGLIDSHVHILGGGGEGGPKTRTPEITLTDITTGGVTTVCGLLGTDGTTRTMTNLVAKAKGLQDEGISTFIYTGSYQVPVRTLTGSIMDDIILLDSVIGTGEIAISDHRSSSPANEELMRIVSDTRVGGILSAKAGVVNIHVGDGRDMLNPLRYVLDHSEVRPENMCPTHINRNSQLLYDGIDYANTYNGYIDFTTSMDPTVPDSNDISASHAMKVALDHHVDESHITFSSDGQGSLPLFKDGKFIGLGVGKVTSLFDEVRNCVLNENIPLSTALMPVTSNPATLLKLTGKGRIQEGYDSDLVIINEDLSINTVICKGKIMIEHGKVIVKGTFEK